MAIVSGGGGATATQIAASGKVLPVADAASVTVDTTTYNNIWTGSGKLATLVFPQGTAALALAIAGDVFPRALMTVRPADGSYWGNGAINPVNDGAAWWVNGPDANGHYSQVIEGGAFGNQNAEFGQLDANAGYGTQFSGAGGAFRVSAAGNGTVTLAAVHGVPAIGGNVGDFAIRDNGPPHIYRCTVAGIAGAATWVAEVGNPTVSGALATVAPVSGTAFQCLTTRDVFLCVPFTGDATNNAATLLIQLSPDNVTFSTLDTLSVAAALNLTGAINVPVTLAVPQAWYVKLTASHGTIGTSTYY